MVFEDRTEWPRVDEYNLLFSGASHVRAPVVTFELQAPRGRRAPRLERYDAAIVLRHVVPTRSRSWHDYLNALVWASFPIAKTALHKRQHEAIEKWVLPGATQLPNARTRELDALALVDEGGILQLRDGKWVFGHALFEGVVLDNRAMIARTVPLDAGADEADEALAEFITTRLADPNDLPRAPAIQPSFR